MLTIVGANLNGRFVDIQVEAGRIIEISNGLKHRGRVLNAGGGMVTHAYADPHLHLDAVLLGAERPNISGTLHEGIANWSEAREALTRGSVKARALRAIEWCVAQGTTRIRTHVDTGSRVGVEALLELRDEVDDICELQVVAFPQEGVFRQPGQLDELAWAVRAGVDAVGAIPHFEATREDGQRSILEAFGLAEEHGLQVDLHCDESDDPESRFILDVCDYIIKTGFEHHVVAGHCTAMHSYPDDVAERAIELIELAQVQVVANPLDNIVLQGRGEGYPKRRGVTRIPELIEAGAPVGVGHDSIMDPWYPLGRGNMIDAASMLIHVAQMTSVAEVERVFEMLVRDNHAPFGGVEEIAVGSSADLLVHATASPHEAMRTRQAPLYVIRRGRVVASTIPARSVVEGNEVNPGRGP